MGSEARRSNLLFVAALIIIAAAFGAYALIVSRWLQPASRSKNRTSSAAMSDDATRKRLEAARADYRASLLDPRAHIRLADALWQSGRAIDSFYVMSAARELFSSDAFSRAHAEIISGAGGPAAVLNASAPAGADALATIKNHAAIARDYPDSAEGRQALDTLTRLASADENTAANETPYLARTALEELHHDDPEHPGKLSALGFVFIQRGDFDSARALADETLARHPNNPSSAQLMGALALQRKDFDAAARWLADSWERNPNDLYSAANLAQLYEKRRGDPMAALPFFLALYRKDPFRNDDGEALEIKIRRVLDARRAARLDADPADRLGQNLGSDDASFRAEACLRAAKAKDPRWIGVLGELFDDDTEIVRRSADYALYEIGRAAPEALRAKREDWLGARRPLVQIRALNLFADLDGKNILPAVAAALSDGNPAVRALAKIMVLDHYFPRDPVAAAMRKKYLSQEKDPGALSLLARFPIKQ